MKKLLTILFCFISLTFHAVAAEQAEVEKFAKDLADDIIKNVVLAKVPLQQKQDAFRKSFLAAINLKTTARFTLGRYAKTAQPEQLQAYTDALADNIVCTWANRFNDYAGGALSPDIVSFVSTRQNENGDFYVTSKLKLPNSENDIEMIWRVSDKKGKLKLADLIVEGVSMLISYRNEYTAILQQNGGDIPALTEMLEKKNAVLKKTSGKSA
ncbi:MAG: ABC transporter substrate-binding protein [Alphaproteobacteria bacterium]|nr:ABC transporter substrate-binding protein [Alphaproteobacteria bacterium]